MRFRLGIRTLFMIWVFVPGFLFAQTASYPSVDIVITDFIYDTHETVTCRPSSDTNPLGCTTKDVHEFGSHDVRTGIWKGEHEVKDAISYVWSEPWQAGFVRRGPLGLWYGQVTIKPPDGQSGKFEWNERTKIVNETYRYGDADVSDTYEMSDDSPARWAKTPVECTPGFIRTNVACTGYRTVGIVNAPTATEGLATINHTSRFDWHAKLVGKSSDQVTVVPITVRVEGRQSDAYQNMGAAFSCDEMAIGGKDAKPIMYKDHEGKVVPGCGVTFGLKGGQSIDITPDTVVPSNYFKLQVVERVGPESAYEDDYVYQKKICTKESNPFMGTVYTEQGKAWTEVVVDPAFERMMENERDIRQKLPITPIYDLVVRVKPDFDLDCIPKMGAGGEILPASLPYMLPIKASISAGGYRILSTDSFKQSIIKDGRGGYLYEWKIKGWSKGIAENKELEQLIKAVMEKKPVTITIQASTPEKQTIYEKSEIPFSLCAPIFGDGPRKIVSERGKSAERKVDDLVDTAVRYRLKGFEAIEPFMTYKRSFSHFVDLSVHDDTGWLTAFNLFFVGANKQPRKASACGNDASQYFFHTARFTNNYAPYGTGVAFLGIVGTPKEGITQWVDTAMHEMGHSFAGLEDEYHSGFDVTLYYANCVPSNREPYWGSINRSKAFGGDGYYYGDKVQGCQLSSQIRPAKNDLMCGGLCDRDTIEDTSVLDLNVVSCGYVIHAIKYGTASLSSIPKKELVEHWNECMKMKGVVKPAILSSDQVGLSAHSMMAAVSALAAQADVSTDSFGNETINMNFESQFVSVESFTEEGKLTLNEVFESSGNKDDITSWHRATPHPELISLTPLSSDNSKVIPSKIEILGTGFSAMGNEAEIANTKNTYNVRNVSLTASSTLLVTIPQDALSGSYTVKVKNQNGKWSTNLLTFTIKAFEFKTASTTSIKAVSGESVVVDRLTLARQESIKTLYRTLLKKEIDAATLTRLTASSDTIAQIRAKILTSDEYKRLHPVVTYTPFPVSSSNPTATYTPVSTPTRTATPTQTPVSTISAAQTSATTTNTSVDQCRADVQNLYRSLLGREADQGGLDYFCNSHMTIPQIESTLRNSTEYQQLHRSSSQTTAATSTATATPTASPYSSPTSRAPSIEFLANIWTAFLGLFQ